MLADIKRFFDDFLQPANENDEFNADHRLRLATAALLVEVMRADYAVGDEENNAVKQSMKAFFGLSEQEAKALIELAEQEAEDAACHYEFTSLINKGFDATSKVKIIEMLWQVVYADAHVDKYEEAMVRKIADLIHVPHSAFIAAKFRARDA